MCVCSCGYGCGCGWVCGCVDVYVCVQKHVCVHVCVALCQRSLNLTWSPLRALGKFEWGQGVWGGEGVCA